jgi:ribosomal-protein-alanine N-acetyltransferase
MIVTPLTQDDEVLACVAIEAESFTTPTFDLAEERARSHARLLVARETEGGPVAGFALFWLVADEVHVLTVATARAHRRRGVGLALVQAMLAVGVDAGSTRALLEVRKDNDAALALYRRTGFERFNVRAGYYADGEDAIEMSRTLP